MQAKQFGGGLLSPQQAQMGILGQINQPPATNAAVEASKAPQTGFMGGVGKVNDYLQDNRSGMMNMAAGMMGSPGNPGSIGQGFQNFAAANPLDAQRQEKQANQTATEAYLEKNGYDPKTIAFFKANPQAMAEALKPKTSDLTSSMKEYQLAQQQGYDGSFFDYKNGLAGAGATNINIGDGAAPNDAELRKKLNQKEGEAWSGYIEAGNQAAGMQQDMQILQELVKMAPQGPIEGRVAEAFPGFSSSGAAFNAVVKRLAPTMRAEGSGSTSDIEYAGMLRSLPALQNKPEANAMIAATIQAKAAINIERAEVARAYASNQIDAQTARSQMAEINQRSILTPQMRGLIAGLDPGGSASADSLVDKWAN